MSAIASAPLPSKSAGQALQVVGEHASPTPSNRRPWAWQAAMDSTTQWPVQRLQHAPRQGVGMQVEVIVGASIRPGGQVPFTESAHAPLIVPQQATCGQGFVKHDTAGP